MFFQIHIEASKESRSRLKQNIIEYLKKNTQKSQSEVIQALNTRLKGWLNYYNMPGDTAIWNTTE
ncbi:TPA: hypothetical protein DIC62_02005 [Candidatus Nomurabacteria bacterium]|nr:hypothetical protein [Candidatus Nomurabacteria bacterium]